MYDYLLVSTLLIISVVEIPSVLCVALNLPNFLGIEYASYKPAVTYGASSCATKSILCDLMNY